MIELHLGDCKDVLAGMPDGCIDLTVTSPPYDNLRTYKGYTFDFEPIARQLYRVTKPGGVVVWVVGDATINGSETGTSFRHALYFKEIGFNLHDTMIYQKTSLSFPDENRYYSNFEFMFVLSKGSPKSFNPIKDKPNKWRGTKIHGTERKTDGSIRQKKSRAGIDIPSHGVRFNVWEIANSGIEGQYHPAPFPEALARDHILSWSNPGDTVLDPMMGSGTTGKMAVKYDRNFIGIEIAADYLAIAERRIKAAQMQPSLLTSPPDQP